MIGDTLFIQRSAQSNILPMELQSNPKSFFMSLLGGHSVHVYREPRNISNRDEYTSRKSPYQYGSYSYRITICVPEKLRRELGNTIFCAKQIAW